MQVTRLSTTPIKGLGLHHPDEIDVRCTGVVGDRRFYLVDDRDALFSIAKTGALVGVTAEYDEAAGRLTVTEGGQVVADGSVVPGETHTADFFAFKKVDGRLVPGPWDEVFSERTGRRLRLVLADRLDGAHDVEPLTLLGDASTRRLAEQAGVGEVDSRRFRMLIEFDGAAAHAEDGWLGQRLQIGTVVAEVGGPVQRCAGTTRNPVSGEVDLRTLQLIGDYRGRQDSVFGMGFNFGVYATVVSEGRIRVGDTLTLLD
jgi:uncharacterized protein YcbX